MSVSTAITAYFMTMPGLGALPPLCTHAAVAQAAKGRDFCRYLPLGPFVLGLLFLRKSFAAAAAGAKMGIAATVADSRTHINTPTSAPTNQHFAGHAAHTAGKVCATRGLVQPPGITAPALWSMGAISASSRRTQP